MELLIPNIIRSNSLCSDGRMSTLFSLKSDNEFISPFDHKRVKVLTYKDDVNDFKTIQGTGYYSCHHWGTRVDVGPGEDYRGIEVFGTAVEGDNFQQLVQDLNAVENGEKIHFFVNRCGLCIISSIKHPTIKAMRINDYFGWSKYGVKLPRDVTKFTVWSRADMHTGETLVDARGTGRAMELEEKKVELEACKKELEETEVELVAFKKELEWSKKIESLQSELMEKKDKEVETMKNQLLAFKDILRSLIDH